MKREEFIFAIGYDGDTALVDGNAMRKYRNAGSAELAGKGQFKPALCAALFDGNLEDIQAMLKIYNEKSGSAYTSIENLKRVFGVYEVPDFVTKVMII